MGDFFGGSGYRGSGERMMKDGVNRKKVRIQGMGRVRR